jgi:isopentenyl phosphate kinase
MMLAALLALGAVPTLAGDVSNDKKSRSAVTSTDEARAEAAKRIEARGVQKQACTCERHGS